jgi:DNA-binding CsgD family transcriptional regulator
LENFAMTGSFDTRTSTDFAAHALGVERADARVLTCMLDVVDYGILLVGADSSVSFANRAARLELDASHPLQLDRHKLTVRLQQDAAPLREALDAALGRGLQRLLTLGQGAQTRVSVAILPADGAGAAASTDAIVVLGKRSVCGELSADAFARQHRLTPAELKVLKLLCAGHHATDIAKLQGVALTTIRTQISSVRDKTGAASIGALVRCVARLPPLASRQLLAA